MPFDSVKSQGQTEALATAETTAGSDTKFTGTTKVVDLQAAQKAAGAKGDALPDMPIDPKDWAVAKKIGVRLDAPFKEKGLGEPNILEIYWALANENKNLQIKGTELNAMKSAYAANLQIRNGSTDIAMARYEIIKEALRAWRQREDNMERMREEIARSRANKVAGDRSNPPPAPDKNNPPQPGDPKAESTPRARPKKTP